jgi:spermidine/putrescine transport system substrate-binding protein
MTDNDKTLGIPAITRRQLLAGGSLAGVAAFLAACGTAGTATESPSSAASASEAPSASASAAASEAASATPEATATPSATVNWANWTYYMDVDPNDQTKHPTLDMFKAKYGTTVNYQEVIDDNESFFGTIQPALQNNQDTGWDVITMTDWMAQKLIRLGWVEQFNKANMPNFTANILPTYKLQQWDPNMDRHAPWQSGMTGLGFNSKVTGAVTSMAQYFTADPRWKGKTDALTEMRDAMGLTMLFDGDDPANPTTDACDRAVATLEKAKSDGIIRSFKGNAYAEDLKSGDAVLAMAWSGDMVQALVDKPTLKFAVPSEGGMLWTDNNMIPKGAVHKGTAELLIDFYYDPKNAALVEDYVNYICPVKGADAAMEAIDPEVAKNPLIFPPQATLDKLHLFGAMDEATEAYYNQQFAKVMGVG